MARNDGMKGRRTAWAHVEHGFGPVWDADCRVLVLGSMPSPKSRQMRFYYGHPRNRFWPVMAAIFHDDGCLCEGMDQEATLGARREFALRHHMALWDVIASCDIAGASDASIRNAVPNDLAPLIEGSCISHVFVTGTKAAQLYHKLCLPSLQARGLGDMPMTRLPSTSPANAGTGLSELVDAYRAVAQAASGVTSCP